jgi:4-hydroxy-3-methylbut-2-enyl diphosphate reductase
VRRFAERGDTVLLVGRDGDLLPTGLERGRILPVEGLAAAAVVQVPDPQRVAAVVRPGLPMEEADAVVAVLRARFPSLVPQHPRTLCHVEADRLATIRELGASNDVLLMAGGSGGPDIGLGSAVRAAVYFAGGLADVRAEWLARAATVGVAPATAASRDLVWEFASALSGLGPVAVMERGVATSAVHVPGLRFKDPVREARAVC